MKESNQENESYQESIKYFGEKGQLLRKENPKVGDFEMLSFPEGRIKRELLGMFNPEIQRTCRITDIYQLPEAENDERVFRVRIEKKYNGERK